MPIRQLLALIWRDARKEDISSLMVCVFCLAGACLLASIAAAPSAFGFGSYWESRLWGVGCAVFLVMLAKNHLEYIAKHRIIPRTIWEKFNKPRDSMNRPRKR